jgi:hypothetical protein
MDVEQVRKANREKFPDFTQFTDVGFKLLWAKHIDGTEIGKDVEDTDGITLSGESAEAMCLWNETLKGKK